ncbi:hypothetical protein ACFLT4_06190 [Chloroflexota bacterium]
MFEWLKLPLGKNKKKTEQLQPKEARDLVREDKASPPPSPDAFRKLLKTAIADAEQIVDSIKMRAQTEAEAEAIRIIAQAKLEVEEIKNRAEAAMPHAEILAPTEARSKTDLATKKMRKGLAQLWEEISRKTKGVGRQTKKETKLAAKGKAPEEKVEEPAQLQEKAPEEKVEEPAQLQEKAPEEKVEEPAQLQEKAPEEKVEEPAQLQEKAPEEKVEEPAQLQEKAPVAGLVEGKTEELPEQHLPEERTSEGKGTAALPKLDREALYTGEVELTIASQAELQLVSRLYNNLQTIPELKILYTKGSWDKGTTIAVVLEKPVSLISILSEIPGVALTPELLKNDAPVTRKSGSPLRGGEREIKRIKLILKEA